MNAHDESFSRVGFVALLTSCLVAAGCGGGGGPSGPAETNLTEVRPAVFFTSTQVNFIVEGANLGAVGGPVTVRFQAGSGTPFDGGTSDSAEVSGIVASSSRIEATTPPDVVTPEMTCDVTCSWPDGTEDVLANAVVFREYTKVFASDAQAEDRFGTSIAVSEETFIVGCPDGGATNLGGAYVYARTGTTWTEEQKLMGSEVEADERFGQAVAISDQTAVVAAHHDSELGSDAGAVYVFVRSGGTWTEQSVIRAPDGSMNDLFGRSVSLDGDTLLVGAAGQSAGDATGAGAAYVYTRSGVLWSFQDKLTVEGLSVGDALGGSVGLHGDLAVVSASGVDSMAGACFVFRRDGDAWQLERRVDPPEPGPGRNFGESVSLWGSQLVVGSPDYDHASWAGSGMAYVFQRGDGSWDEYTELPATTGFSFGSSVSVWDGRVLVGGRADGGDGRAEVWAWVGGEWALESLLHPPDDAFISGFGDAMAVSATTVVAGASFDRDEGTRAGAAYGL